MLFADQAMCRAASRESNIVDFPYLHVVRDSVCIYYECVTYIHIYYIHRHIQYSIVCI